MESVHYFVRGLFRGIAETEKIADQREELEAHINDRITDSIACGMTHNNAFADAIESLGNLDELIETMTGAKKKVFAKKALWYMRAIELVYGTFYMIAVGIWFAYQDFGLLAICVALPGWFGFMCPALFQYIAYRKDPFATGLVAIDRSAEIRASLVGWVSISLVCWVANFLLMGSDTFLHVQWAWMPTFGVLSWPLSELFYTWIVKNLKSLGPETAAVDGKKSLIEE
jgi:hypothetical protein